MLGKLHKRVRSWIAISAIPLSFLCCRSSQVGLRPSDIRSSEDSIIVGRLRFLPGSTCARSYQLPVFELRNITENKSVSFAAPEWTKLTPGLSIDIPISRKVTPGAHDIRMEVERGRWDSVWLDENLLTLGRFEVPKGLLVYFGTIEVELSCVDSHKRGQAHYARHTIQNEFEHEIQLFRDEFPQIYELYKNKIVHEEPEEPWKNL